MGAAQQVYEGAAIVYNCTGTAKWNEELLQMSGFREIDCFWRWVNFAGWIAVK